MTCNRSSRKSASGRDCTSGILLRASHWQHPSSLVSTSHQHARVEAIISRLVSRRHFPGPGSTYTAPRNAVRDPGIPGIREIIRETINSVKYFSPDVQGSIVVLVGGGQFLMNEVNQSTKSTISTPVRHRSCRDAFSLYRGTSLLRNAPNS